VISRNIGQVLFQGNLFIFNMGSFGGVASINSPDWQNGDNPVIVLKDNWYE